MDIKKWKIISEKILFKKRMINITEMNSIREKDEKHSVFYRFNFRDWVNIIPITSNAEILLEKQWRHGISQMSIEIPGGLCDKGEAPETTAKRELQEETGYTSDEWIYLGFVYPNPAIQTNKCHIFLALNAKLTHKTSFDPDEEIQPLLLSLDEVDVWIAEGRISNAISLAALSLLKSKYVGRGLK